MADGFEVKAARLTEEAGRFGPLAGRAGEIHRDLAARLATAGQCWGADEVGASFAAAHVSPAEQTLGALAALPGLLGDAGGRFGATATAYRTGDGDNATTINASDD